MAKAARLLTDGEDGGDIVDEPLRDLRDVQEAVEAVVREAHHRAVVLDRRDRAAHHLARCELRQPLLELHAAELDADLAADERGELLGSVAGPVPHGGVVGDVLVLDLLDAPPRDRALRARQRHVDVVAAHADDLTFVHIAGLEVPPALTGLGVRAFLGDVGQQADVRRGQERGLSAADVHEVAAGRRRPQHGACDDLVEAEARRSGRLVEGGGVEPDHGARRRSPHREWPPGQQGEAGSGQEESGGRHGGTHRFAT
eukprot:scaffold94639_cov72-Phaeocystis_antarctica.AAC.2